ncbi:MULTISPECIES: DUF6044 family protein [unclassified Mesobacillus]|uniref:DUF6044 family protein n=1 Tax=unclassified Mesobacillus TaxID=2675270 RepID=UPI0020405572|nr:MULTISPECIES: DUF6044 family protein [unclassified Mesobacillus]MCM3121841.1 DUF6044 family protein [Mesobacillus sp. MER 33]MCM3231805.1 DUF6044 family protein [Mesobacillus sp. MER 48]
MSYLQEKESKYIILSLLVISVFVLPYFILGDDAHIRVHDNLDSNLAWYKFLAESGQIAGSAETVIPQVINGLPRNALGTEFSLIVWLYVWFPTMIAYGISQAITRFFAFLGMYLLLKDHFITSRERTLILIGTALAFALTPFWPSGMLSTLGMPLALWAFLHIRQGNGKWSHYLTLTLLPFYSSIVLGFFFFLSAMGLLWIRDAIRQKAFNWRFLIAIVYMTAVYLITDYRLVYSFLFDSEPNSRDEYFHARLSFFDSVRLTFKNFIFGHTHAMTVHTFIILPVIIAAMLILWKHRRWEKERIFVFLFLLNFLLSAWYAFWFYKGWVPLTERFHFLDTFNFARYHFLRPLIIYILFAVGLRILWEEKLFQKTVPFLIGAQIILLLFSNEEIVQSKKPSVSEFYAEKQFEAIKDHIGKPQSSYRIANIGLHPAIAQYNGFYTLDTYNNFYPLRYKHQFRKIIENELEKNQQIRTYFDEWGGRCYLFTDELGKHYMFKKNSKKRIKNLDINIEPFKQMGGEYIFSAVPIDNAIENDLKLDAIFTSDASAWKIYLYQVL